VSWLITLRMRVIYFFEISGTTYPTTQRNNPEDLFPQKSRGGNLRSLFLIVKTIFIIVSSSCFIVFLSMIDWL
jgi:hypothetical protein